MAVFELDALAVAMKQRSGLIHHITNWSRSRAAAQVARRWGCLPVMAHAREEVEEMVELASALVLNIGTLTTELVDVMLVAAKAANCRRIPVVLDAVGVGRRGFAPRRRSDCSPRRESTFSRETEGEIATLAGVSAEVRGVESIAWAATWRPRRARWRRSSRNVVVVSGAQDIVTDAGARLSRRLWPPDDAGVVGTGCLSSTTVGCFVSTGGPHVELAAQAMAAFRDRRDARRRRCARLGRLPREPAERDGEDGRAPRRACGRGRRILGPRPLHEPHRFLLHHRRAVDPPDHARRRRRCPSAGAPPSSNTATSRAATEPAAGPADGPRLPEVPRALHRER